jgi:anti-anti-sigma factor
MNDDRVDSFSVCISLDGHRVAVTVDGEVDARTAPSLVGVLAAMIGVGHRDLVVDFGGVTFIDAAGVSVLTTAADLATSAGSTVTLRSVPAAARWILDITRVSDLFEFETAAPARSESGAAEAAGDQLTNVGEAARSVPAPSGHGLARSSTDVIDAALRLVTSLAGSTVDHADGVSVTLERHGQLMTVAATDDTVYTMDQHQYETGEGPCLSAKEEGRWFYVESLEDETRWPAFVPLALEGGIRSVLSSPLVARDRPQGALNIYSNTRQAFGTREQELAALFAEQASQILTTAGQELTDDESNLRFVSALTARQTIHQAQGVLMARNDVSANDAIGSLFREARTAEITVLARAGAVLASTHRVDGDG